MKIWWTVVLLMVVGGSAFAQGLAPVTTSDEAMAQLHGQPLMLRGFWAKDKLEFDQDGKPLKDYPTESFTECGFDLKQASLSDGRLHLEGERVGLEFNSQGVAVRKPVPAGGLGFSHEKIAITIDGNGNPDFAKALNAIFATSLRDIAASLPEYWQAFVQASLARKSETDPVKMARQLVAGKVFHIGGNVAPPKLLKSVNPKFDMMSRKFKYSGSTEIYLIVDVNGEPTHVSIVRPVGLGLDEEAVAAVSQYSFRPAMKKGKPIAVDMYVDTNFRIW